MNQTSYPLLDGRYRITALLYAHTSERRYSATHVELNIPITVIAMRRRDGDAGHDDASHTQFRTLATAATRLRHPALPRVRDAFRQGEIYYLIMDAVPGESLSERLYRQRPLSIREALALSLQLCAALTDIAQTTPQLVPLLSLTPDTVVLTSAGRAMVTDLGARRWLGIAPTQSFTAPALSFVAPEVATGSAATADARADIYSVAAMLYTALAGQPPAPLGLGRARLEALQPLVPAALSDVIERGLRPDPARRFASAEEFGHALAEVVNASLPALVALATSPRAQISRPLVSRVHLQEVSSLPATAHVEHRVPSRLTSTREPRSWSRRAVLSSRTWTGPLRRTGERAIAALASALHATV